MLWEVGWDGSESHGGVGGRVAHVVMELGGETREAGGGSYRKQDTSQIIYDSAALNLGCFGFGVFQPS